MNEFTDLKGPASKKQIDYLRFLSADIGCTEESVCEWMESVLDDRLVNEFGDLTKQEAHDFISKLSDTKQANDIRDRIKDRHAIPMFEF